jgi:membrane protease YdiL (CAAX protease family)
MSGSAPRLRWVAAPKGRRDAVWALAGAVAAFGLWYAVFIWSHGVFWLKIAAASAALAALSLIVLRGRAREYLRLTGADLLLGAVSSLVLWGVFWAGKRLLVAAFGGAESAIRSVYAPREQAPEWVIGLLLLLVTGPCEEIFWRGLVQRAAVESLGVVRGLLLASCVYAAVHLWTLNGPLVLAAFVAGLFWGAMSLRRRSLAAVMVSHGLWGLLVFVVLPLA